MEIDPSVKALTIAIKQSESGGNYNIKGASGESGGYQFMPSTWKAWAGEFLGDQNAEMNEANQNKVAYSKVKQLKDQGYTPGQIASVWNSGKPDAYKQNFRGVNSMGVAYDTPKYVKSVLANFNQAKSRIAPPTPPTPTYEQPKSNVPFAYTGKETPLGAGAKMLGNMPASIWNTAKGVLGMLNPVSIAKNIASIPGEVSALSREQAAAKQAQTGVAQKPSIMGALGAAGRELPKASYETLVPEAAKGGIEAGASYFKGDQEGIDRGLQRSAKALVETPVESVAPFVGLGEFGLRKISPKASAAVQKAVTKTTNIATAPARAVGNMAKSTAKFGVSQATGLSRLSIDEIIKNPKKFTPEEMAKTSRESIGKKVEDALTKKSEAISETGKGYNVVRQSPKAAKVTPNFLAQEMERAAGVAFEKGKIKVSGNSKVREARDVRALQNLYDVWQPSFKKGFLTPNEFLNFRSDLTRLSKFERDIGKSQALDNVAKSMRYDTNQVLRNKFEGLKELDDSFAPKIEEYNRLKESVLDRHGELTPTGINRIANSLGKGKASFASQLEEISPGITQKVRYLKAVEDIKYASEGTKVGTYARSILGAGSALAMNIPGIIAAILAQPEIAVKILRSYGFAMEAVKPVIAALIQKANTDSLFPMKKGAFSKGEPLSGESALLAEARKYKTPEEFVKAQGKTFYRGGVDLAKEKITDSGISVATHESIAKDFVKNKGGQVGEYVISPSAKIINYSDIPGVKFKNLNDYSSELDIGNKQIWRDLEVEYQKAVNWAKTNGYDGVKLPLEGETRIINPDVLKTKSQLTDIWNKAQQSGKAPIEGFKEGKAFAKETPKIADEEGKYLYHGTNEDVLGNITKEGLKPMGRGEISLSKDENYAGNFAREGITPQGKTSPVMLRVNSDYLKGKTIISGKARPMSDQLNEILTRESIPPEALEIKKNGKWQPLKPKDPNIKETPKIADEMIAKRKAIADEMIESGSWTGKSAEGDVFGGPIEKGKKMYVVIGPSAAGKSELFANPLSRKHKALIVDPDRVAAKLASGADRASVQGVSSDLSEGVLLPRALNEGMNVVLPKVGKTPQVIEELAALAKSKGYEINLVLNDLSPEGALLRANARAQKTGRVVPEDYIMNVVGRKPFETYKAMLDKHRAGDKTFNSITAFSNEVGKGRGLDLIDTTDTSFAAVSPNVKTSLTYDEAVKNLKTPEHQKAIENFRNIDREMDIPVASHSAVGAWADGAENTTYYHDGLISKEALTLNAVRKGLADGIPENVQKQVIIFRSGKGVPMRDDFYEINFTKGKEREIFSAMQEKGIPFQTVDVDKIFVANKAGEYFDSGMIDKLDLLKNQFGDTIIGVKSMKGEVDFIGSWLEDDLKARTEAKAIYEKIIEYEGRNE